MAGTMHDVTFNVPSGAELLIDDLHSCLQDGKVVCDWPTLEGFLINHTVSDQWWDLTEAERRSIAEMAIKNTWLYMLKYGREGKSDCDGGEGDYKSIACVQNAIIRYLKFGSSSFIDSTSKCYWKRDSDDVEHCYVTSMPYNLPCYFVEVNGERFGHVLCAIHIKQGFESLDNFMVFQYSDLDIKPGDQQMPTGMHIQIEIPTSIGCSGFSHHSIAEFDT